MTGPRCDGPHGCDSEALRFLLPDVLAHTALCRDVWRTGLACIGGLARRRPGGGTAPNLLCVEFAGRTLPFNISMPGQAQPERVYTSSHAEGAEVRYGTTSGTRSMRRARSVRLRAPLAVGAMKRGTEGIGRGAALHPDKIALRTCAHQGRYGTGTAAPWDGRPCHRCKGSGLPVF